ncbi:MAG: hypothetical protein AAF650_06415 [Pseudomonadota bacterium]
MTEHLPATTSSSNSASNLDPAGRPGERFTRAQQALFLELLAEWGNVRAAAKAVGVSRQHAYRVRRACPEFALAWDAARLAALPKVEDVLADRALNGVEEQVFYHGEEVAVRRRYDARLLLAHVSRLDRLTQDGSVRAASEGFDAQLEALEGLPEIEWVSVPVEDAPDAENGEEARAGACAGTSAGPLEEDGAGELGDREEALDGEGWFSD